MSTVRFHGGVAITSALPGILHARKAGAFRKPQGFRLIFSPALSETPSCAVENSFLCRRKVLPAPSGSRIAAAGGKVLKKLRGFLYKGDKKQERGEEFTPCYLTLYEIVC